ncbi:MAG: type II secretion system protein [Phycisphaerales bacterium]
MRRAFSLVELMIVVVILGILAAVALPQFAGATDEARTTATKSALSGVRSAIATYRTAAVVAGDDPFPTLAELTDGTVVSFDVPANPYTSVAGIQAVNQSQANARQVTNGTTAGWNYYFDNSSTPPVAIFYANCSDATTDTDSAGAAVAANNL